MGPMAIPAGAVLNVLFMKVSRLGAWRSLISLGSNCIQEKQLCKDKIRQATYEEILFPLQGVAEAKILCYPFMITLLHCRQRPEM